MLLREPGVFVKCLASVSVCLILAFLPAVSMGAEADPRINACAQEVDPVRRNAICTELIEAKRLDLENLLWAYNSRAIARFELGKITAASKDVTIALKLDPDFAPAYYTRGEIYRRTGEPEKAIEQFGQALQAISRAGTWIGNETVDGTPSRGTDLRLSVLISRSAALIALKRLDAAEADCRLALTITLEDARPYINLGHIYALRGDYQAATWFHERAISLAPDDVELQADLETARRAAKRR